MVRSVSITFRQHCVEHKSVSSEQTGTIFRFPAFLLYIACALNAIRILMVCVPITYVNYRIFPKYGPGVNYFQVVIRSGVKLNQAFF